MVGSGAAVAVAVAVEAAVAVDPGWGVLFFAVPVGRVFTADAVSKGAVATGALEGAAVFSIAGADTEAAGRAVRGVEGGAEGAAEASSDGEPVCCGAEACSAAGVGALPLELKSTVKPKPSAKAAAAAANTHGLRRPSF